MFSPAAGYWIRPARSDDEDLEALRIIGHCLYNYPVEELAKSRTRDNLADNWHLRCAKRSGETMLLTRKGLADDKHVIVGATRITPDPSGDRDPETDDVVNWSITAIMPDHRGKGLSKPLREAAIKATKKLIIKSRVDADNPASWRVAEKMGYQHEKDDGKERIYSLRITPRRKVAACAQIAQSLIKYAVRLMAPGGAAKLRGLLGRRGPRSGAQEAGIRPAGANQALPDSVVNAFKPGQAPNQALAGGNWRMPRDIEAALRRQNVPASTFRDALAARFGTAGAQQLRGRGTESILWDLPDDRVLKLMPGPVRKPTTEAELPVHETGEIDIDGRGTGVHYVIEPRAQTESMITPEEQARVLQMLRDAKLDPWDAAGADKRHQFGYYQGRPVLVDRGAVSKVAMLDLLLWGLAKEADFDNPRTLDADIDQGQAPAGAQAVVEGDEDDEDHTMSGMKQAEKIDYEENPVLREKRIRNRGDHDKPTEFGFNDQAVSNTKQTLSRTEAAMRGGRKGDDAQEKMAMQVPDELLKTAIFPGPSLADAKMPSTSEMLANLGKKLVTGPVGKGALIGGSAMGLGRLLFGDSTKPWYQRLLSGAGKGALLGAGGGALYGTGSLVGGAEGRDAEKAHARELLQNYFDKGMSPEWRQAVKKMIDQRYGLNKTGSDDMYDVPDELIKVGRDHHDDGVPEKGVTKSQKVPDGGEQNQTSSDGPNAYTKVLVEAGGEVPDELVEDAVTAA